MNTDTRKQYVVSLTSLNDSPVDLVGVLAKEIEKVQLLSINTPIGFVVTAHAFDDFLMANDLLEFISPRINDIDYADEKSVKRASEEIKFAIQNAIFPDIVSSPIVQAYSGLSGFYDAFVSIKQSPINSMLDEKTFTETKVYTNVTGKELLLEKIKEAWSQLFTVEALKHRTENGYEGYLTDAVIIQKMLQSEINGKLFSYNSYDGDKGQVEVQAFFGLNDVELWKNMLPDSYIIDKKTQEILEKKIIAQEFMLVRKGRTVDKTPVIKVPISKLWHKKQKLDDKFILALFRQCMILEENFKQQIEVSWEFEAGKMYIVDFDITHTQTIPELEIKKIVPKQVEAPKKKSVDEYVEEVGSMKKNISTISRPLTDEQVVVNIKPVEELHIIAQGTSKGEKLVFGLVHIILSEADFANLTGDEILIIKDVNPRYYNELNSVKGLVIQADIDSSDLLDIKVPVISNVKEAMDTFQENEVITLRPWNASIYLGAGKESDAQNKEVPKIAQVIEQETPQAATPIEDVKDDGDIIFEPKIEKVFPAKTEKSTEVPVKGDQEPSIKLVSTILDFWQAYYPHKTVEKLDGIDGFVVRVADIMENYNKTIFASELSSKLIRIIDEANGKPVILVSAGRDSLQEEIVEAELNAIGDLRNKDYLRNLWYSLDNVVDVDDLVKLKKLITTKGFRRSSSFKLLLTIHSPQSLITLKGLLATSVDGVIIDMDLAFKEHGIKVKHNDPHIIEYISHKIAQISEEKTLSMLLSYEHKLETDALTSFMKAGLNALVLDTEQIIILKPAVVELESKLKVERKKKRGRKRKEIDFGY